LLNETELGKKIGKACFQTSVVDLTTLWATSIIKYILYEKGKTN